MLRCDFELVLDRVDTKAPNKMMSGFVPVSEEPVHKILI